MPRDDDWLSISEAAQVLDVSVSTLRAWSASGRIPCARTRGGHRRFSRLELRRWMAVVSAFAVTAIATAWLALSAKREVEKANGEFIIGKYDPAFAAAMALAEEIMHEDRDILRVLAK